MIYLFVCLFVCLFVLCKVLCAWKLALTCIIHHPNTVSLMHLNRTSLLGRRWAPCMVGSHAPIWCPALKLTHWLLLMGLTARFSLACVKLSGCSCKVWAPQAEIFSIPLDFLSFPLPDLTDVRDPPPDLCDPDLYTSAKLFQTSGAAFLMLY